MIRRSVAKGGRRRRTSPRACRALVALVLMALLSASAAAEDLQLQPALATDEFSVDQADAERAVPAAPRRQPSRESDDLATALGRKGDLNLHGLSLNAALFTISEQWNINVVAGEVQGTVNGVFKQAPLREILDSILLSNGYNYRAVGNSLVVSSTADLGQINPFFQSATIPVQSADLDEVMEGARLLTTPQGQVRAIKSARSLIVLDFPDRVEMIREFVSTIDRVSGSRFAGAGSRYGLPLEVGHFRTQYISAEVAREALNAVLSKDGRANFLTKEDRLVVTDYAENLTMVEQVLLRVDRPRPQVRITALIYDIGLEDIDLIGINWTQIGYTNGSTSLDFGIGTVPFSGGGGANGDGTDGGGTNVTILDGSNLTFGALTRHFDILSVAKALQSARDSRLLANPSVAVLDNEEAVFRSVTEIPIQQLTQTQQGGQIGTTAFRDAGITLTVTPKVAADGTIALEVAPEFSRHVGDDSNGQPIIDTREARTILRVANRQTVVIGGLRKREDIGDFSGVPYLKDIGGVGRLFRSRNTRVRESELIVFISPEIIGYADEPTLRQQLAADTVRCRLDRVPEAEGCPPCCRRLPPGPMAQWDGYVVPDESMPPLELEYDEQYDAAVETPPLATLPDAPRRLPVVVRRLPTLEDAPAGDNVVEVAAAVDLFGAPPQP